MFESDIRIFGKHAIYMKTYSRDKQGENQYPFKLKDNENNVKIVYVFETMIKCYLIAAMIGVIEKRKAPEDNSDKSIYANIMTEQVRSNRINLKRVVQHMILASEEGSVDGRVKKAFSLKTFEDKEVEKELNDYARGGLEIIHELFEPCRTYEDAANAIFQLAESYGVYPIEED